jgi:hypothetical protein
MRYDRFEYIVWNGVNILLIGSKHLLEHWSIAFGQLKLSNNLLPSA